ncbi:hypothetical protein [Moraxella lacunata]|uniref:hypothetical protein n=1 Tax=Moraxella lacunata TaxID=477 RepID=UPI003EE04254
MLNVKFCKIYPHPLLHWMSFAIFCYFYHNPCSNIALFCQNYPKTQLIYPISQPKIPKYRHFLKFFDKF